jgi:hypothetical protein
LAVLACLASVPALAQQRAGVVIRNAQIIDGRGGTARRGDVRI